MRPKERRQAGRLLFNNLELAPTVHQEAVATKELRELRAHYRAAYTAYMECVKQLSDASQRGEWPSAEVLSAEEKTLNDLTSFRKALLAALSKHVSRA
jgi:hypothetical protein